MHTAVATPSQQAVRAPYPPRRLNFRGGESDVLAYVLSRNLAYIVQFHPVEGEHGSNEFQIAHLLIDSK
jgi:hypothetical protein